MIDSDIDIAVAQTPKPITLLAAEIGIRPDELESYGKYKAKVELSILKRLEGRKDGKYIVISGYVTLALLFDPRLRLNVGLHRLLLVKANLPPQSDLRKL
jgi:methylenetetrahydrofolate dehydrogenase (NADP+)/methenyltetrahydrofolate cyclohydrolase/formyltetrahydrofolate synthetase